MWPPGGIHAVKKYQHNTALIAHLATTAGVVRMTTMLSYLPSVPSHKSPRIQHVHAAARPVSIPPVFRRDSLPSFSRWLSTRNGNLSRQPSRNKNTTSYERGVYHGFNQDRDR